MPPKTPQTPEEWNAYDAAHPGADPLADAKISLGNLNKFSDENNLAGIAAIPDSLAALKGVADNRGGYRKFTEGLGGLGAKAGGASLALAGAGLVPGPHTPFAAAGAGGLGIASQFAMAPDFIRRWVNPESDEQHPGAFETAATVAPVALPKILASMRGLRGAAKAAPMEVQQGAEMFGDAAKRSGGLPFSRGTEVPYRAGGSTGIISAAEDALPTVSTGASILPDSWKQFAHEPTPKAPYVHPPYQSLPKGVDSVADTLGPLDSHAAGGPLANKAVESTKSNIPSGGLKGLKDASKPAIPPYVSPEYAKELGRMGRVHPTPNATAVFDTMSSNGEFGPEMQGFTNRQYNIDLTDELNAITGQPHSQGLANILHQQEAMTDQANSSVNPHEALAILKRLAER